MESYWKIIPLVLCAGCTGTTKSWMSPITDLPQQVQQAVMPEQPPLPATEFKCAWANRLQQLPDPTREGQMVSGIVGQAFLFLADITPADPHGEMTIMVSDATIPGQPMHTPEAWHFTSATLKNMVVNDDRYGRSLAVFLPWPPEWRNVNRLAIQGRYDQKDAQPIFSQVTVLTLDLSASGGATAGGVVTNSSIVVQGVPDPARQIKTMNRAEIMPITNSVPNVQPAGFTALPQPSTGNRPSLPNVPQPQFLPPPPPGEFHRQVIKRGQ